MTRRWQSSGRRTSMSGFVEIHEGCGGQVALGQARIVDEGTEIGVKISNRCGGVTSVQEEHATGAWQRTTTTMSWTTPGTSCTGRSRSGESRTTPTEAGLTDRSTLQTGLEAWPMRTTITEL